MHYVASVGNYTIDSESTIAVANIGAIDSEILSIVCEIIIMLRCRYARICGINFQTHLTRVSSAVIEAGAHKYVRNVFLPTGSKEHIFAFIVADYGNGYLRFEKKEKKLD